MDNLSTYKSGFVAIIGVECGKVHIDESSDWTEDCDYKQQSADDEEPDPDSIYG